MPIPVTESPYRPVPLEPRRKRWTRSDCSVFEATGLWDEQRLELIEGELIDKMGKNRPHTNALVLIQAWLIGVFGVALVNPETSIDVAPADNPTSEPEPDLIVLRRPTWEYTSSNPKPEDIQLLVEVSDSTLGFDLTRKAALYARAGIPEYWVLDVAARRLIVHREPADGRYSTITADGEAEAVAPLAAPAFEFRVAEAFRRS